MSEEVYLKVSVVVPDINNVVESSTARDYRPVHLRSVVSKVFEEHLDFFVIFSMVLGLRLTADLQNY